GEQQAEAESEADAQDDDQRDRLKEACPEASQAATSLYPAPRTVRIPSGSPSLRRSCATCTSTVRVPPGYVIPHTRSSSRSRERTMPGCSRKQARRSNSLLVSSTCVPATVTSWESRRRITSRAARTSSSFRLSERRRIALIRADSSRGENGFAT